MCTKFKKRVSNKNLQAFMAYFILVLVLPNTIYSQESKIESKNDGYSSPNEVFSAWIKAGEKQDWKRALSLFTPESQKAVYMKTILGAGMFLAFNENKPEYKKQITELDTIWEKYKIIELGNAAEDGSYLWNIENKENFYSEIMTVLAKNQKVDTCSGRRLQDLVIDGDAAEGISVYGKEGELKQEKMKFKKVKNNWYIEWQEENSPVSSNNPNDNVNKELRFQFVEALEKGDLETIKDGIANGIDADKSLFGWPPIITAAYKGQKDVVLFLLGQGVDANATASDEQTALHIVAVYDRIEIAKILIENGANINLKTKKGITPLHAATSGTGSGDVARLLIELGVNVNFQDNEGNTPLHKTASGYTGITIELIDLLIQNGANPNIQNNEGKTPLDVAINLGYEEVINYLNE